MFDCGMLKSEKKHALTKADIWFLCGLMAAALLILLFFNLNRTRGGYVEISYDGVVLWKIPLPGPQEEKCYLLTDKLPGEDGAKDLTGISQMTLKELVKGKDMEWGEFIAQAEVENQTGDYNIFLCQDGNVQMIKSNCPDQICVQHYPISDTGENIICLPHKVVIAVTGESDGELDGVTY